jgi:[acyl-carrier-protein] S-malonyltransferase
MTDAFLFPGQGSQSVGMMDALAQRHSVVRSTFDEASDVLGSDLWQLVHEGPKETLDETIWTQPAMLAGGVATYRAWRNAGGAPPAAMAGHSLGEYSALVSAGALDFADAVGLIARRAQLMRDAVPAGGGAMVAVIGLGDDEVRAACAAVAGDDVVEPVNFNAPGQVVVAGNAAGVERLIARAHADGARRVLPLPVSVPSHSSLMKPAADEFARALAKVEFKTPSARILYNAGPVVAGDSDSLRAALRRQLHSPVPWCATIETLISDGTPRFVECGPGRVLSGLVKRIYRRANVVSLHDAAALDEALGVTETEEAVE